MEINVKNIVTKPAIFIHPALEEIFKLFCQDKEIYIDNQRNIDNIPYGIFYMAGFRKEFPSKALYKELNRSEARHIKYTENYNATLSVAEEVKKLLVKHSEDVIYSRTCPISGYNFNEIKGNDLLEVITSDPFITKKNWYEYELPVISFNKLMLPLDDLHIQELYHPAVVKEIMNKWNFERELKKELPDNTVISLNIEDGKILVYYNLDGYQSLQLLKLYTNRKGIFYKIRGSKRVFVELPSISIQDISIL